MADKNTDYKDESLSVPYLSGIFGVSPHIVTLPHGTKGYGNSEEEALQDAIDNQKK